MNTKKIIMLVVIVCLFVGFRYFYEKQKYVEEDNIEEELLNFFAESKKNANRSVQDIFSNGIDSNDMDAVYLRICEKCDYGYDFSQCNEYEKNYFLIYQFMGEVGNGGIEQFFANCYENVEVTNQCFDTLKLTYSQEFLTRAINIYPQHYIEYLSDEKVTEKMLKLDDEYYDKMDKECVEFLKEYLIDNEE